MSEILNQKLFTPNELANANVGLSLVTQWNKRKTGELKFLRVGKKIFYTPEHIDNFFANCEQSQTENVEVATV